MRLIDADALKDWSEIVPLTDDGGIDINDFDEKLMSMPTVDAVPVIRCKDCKYQQKEYHEDKRRKDGGYYIYWCEKTDGYSPLGFDNQYCSEAERKEE